MCSTGKRGYPEINFLGLCKGWQLACRLAGIKVGCAPNSPRVAHELHAGNHRIGRTPTDALYVTLPFYLTQTYLHRSHSIALSRESVVLLHRHVSCRFDNMRSLIFLALVAAAHSQEYFRQPEKIISENRNVGDNLGQYSFTYETEGGIVQTETGSRKYAGTPSETQLIQGSVQYNAPDGTPIAISWTADEFGTQVAGTHVPTPPPIPPAIQRALDWIAKQPSTPEPEEAAKDSPSQQNAVPASTNRQHKPLRTNQRN